MPATRRQRIDENTRFRSYYADGNPLWKPVQRRGQGVWICEIVPEPVEINGETVMIADYQGSQRAFTEEEIQASLRQSELYDALEQRDEDFWGSKDEGDVLHYDNGFGQYVRGVVATNEKGEKGLRPTALVGNWREYDLPKRQADGSIYLPYHAKKVVDGDDWFRPNVSTIYEAPDHRSRAGEADPRSMDAIDLSVPQPTEEENREFGRYRLLEAIREAASDTRDVEAALARVKELAKQI